MDEYPDLLRPLDDPDATGRFVVCDALPPEELISDAYLVPQLGSSWLYFLDASGRLRLPGGSKQAGETHRHTLERELRGGVGAQLDRFCLIGHWHMHSNLAAPPEPHLPHPEWFAVVGCGHVELIGAPADPSGSTDTLEVRVSGLSRVVEAFLADGRHDLADLYRLAARLVA